MMMVREFGYEVELFLRELPSASDVYYSVRHVSSQKTPEFRTVFIELGYFSIGANMIWRVRKYAGSYVFKLQADELKTIEVSRESVLKKIRERSDLFIKYGYLLEEETSNKP